MFSSKNKCLVTYFWVVLTTCIRRRYKNDICDCDKPIKNWIFRQNVIINQFLHKFSEKSTQKLLVNILIWCKRNVLSSSTAAEVNVDDLRRHIYYHIGYCGFKLKSRYQQCYSNFGKIGFGTSRFSKLSNGLVRS